MAAAKRYTLAARLLHWGTVALVAMLFSLGLMMTRGTLSIEALFSAYQWHKTLGVLVWMMTVVRLSVRYIIPPPEYPTERSPRHLWLVVGTHAALYALLVLLPMSGWLMASASPLSFPISLFGIDVPLLAALQNLPDGERNLWFNGLQLAHSAMAGSLFFLLVLHAAGALRLPADLRRRMSIWPRPSTARSEHA